MSRTQLPPLPPSLNLDHNAVKPSEQKAVKKSYSISSTNIRYNLPAVTSLQPGVDTTSGNLDTWPAHAEGPGPPAIGTEHPSRNAEFLPKGNYKPKFLGQLESFLKKELRALGCTESKPSDKRLQAFREVFEYLMEDFKTYRPLLSAIKNEYEMMIIHQRDRIRELEPLKAMLVTVSEQCDKSLLAMKEEEKEDLEDMKRENQRLQGVIGSLRDNELTLNAQVVKLQQELAAEYLKYRNECDARKMLIADMNDLRAQQEDANKSSMLDTESVDGKKEDSTFLRIALKKAREDIEIKNQKLAQMEADYGDVVPRRDYEKLKEQFHALERDLEKVIRDQEMLMKEHSTLLDVHRKTEDERNEYARECESMRRCATPRPRWAKCGQYIEGGEERWKEISGDKTSDEMVDVLLAEITGTDIAVIQAGSSAVEEFFEGQGLGANIPKYLRYEGKVRNRRISKRDVLLLIKDVWQERLSSEIETSSPEYELLPSFLHSYLDRRFGAENLTFEWAYNVQDACVRYQHDPRIGLFHRILSGEMDEALYHDQRAMFKKFSNALMAADPGESDDRSVPKHVFEGCVRQCFPLFGEQAIADLMKLAETEMSGENVLYKNILKEDDEGGVTLFVDKIFNFDKMERMAYVREVENSLAEKSEVSEGELRQAFMNVDPGLPLSMLDQYVNRAFGEESATKADDTMDRATVIQRLQTGSVRRFASKSQE
ncbi:translin-associated factor X-interacting protein 1-like [Dendronephthya gigantea]|uniref:translin-associated factor X-interacting protein 1-like n=1 Tax=Dendronephthya gigantea TaxID=151771 RepID=UPI00106B30F2|nr:translin-associated factor X-interacting protein 1-like [Dendronephthya gigantea]XP_028391684.1 translin-associated factor X-interacting protein 1-like [Dendronephthya gigantea]XP_028391686.1 translin-associated factor X-interacting protein 1-like [Dendronephthya gigantea]XP_028391687.1 translin-associated factor X-interacting protein 1-like [Dendronephthya gigantea]XP_028391688.1 translin-associated factor X-interacting protein 1-like [Dendronephthya gigantea]